MQPCRPVDNPILTRFWLLSRERWMQWPTLRVQTTDTEKDITDSTTNGCRVDILSGCNNCRCRYMQWRMHQSTLQRCGATITLAKVGIVEITPNYHYMAPCLGVSALGSWRMRKRYKVIIVNQEVLILFLTTTYRSEAF